MSNPPLVPAASNTFERLKRFSSDGNESWSARDLARVLEYLNFRNFQPVIEKAKEACLKSGHALADHIAPMRTMVEIGSRTQRAVDDWMLSRYTCYLVIQNADPSKPSRWSRHHAGEPARGGKHQESGEPGEKTP